MKRSIVPVSLLVGVLALAAADCNLLKKGQGTSDQAITSDIQAKLFQDPVLKTRDIRVNTENGVVTLSGTVNTDLEKAAVERFANQEKSVKQVVDQLAVGGAASAEVAQATPAPAPTATPPAPPAAHPKARKKHAKEAAASSASPTPEAPAPPTSSGAAPVVEQPPEAAPPAPPQPTTATVPAGTTVTVRMIDGVDSAVSQPGQEFSASLAAPVAVGSQVVIPMNSSATVRLVTAKSSGKFAGSAQLALELTSVAVNGTSYNVQSSTFEQTGSSRGKRTATAVGGGAALGGLIGAIAGGGKGAAIGAGVGAATGTGVQAASKRGEVKVPSETKIDFVLKAPLTITLSQ